MINLDGGPLLDHGKDERIKIELRDLDKLPSREVNIPSRKEKRKGNTKSRNPAASGVRQLRQSQVFRICSTRSDFKALPSLIGGTLVYQRVQSSLGRIRRSGSQGDTRDNLAVVSRTINDSIGVCQKQKRETSIT